MSYIGGPANIECPGPFGSAGYDEGRYDARHAYYTAHPAAPLAHWQEDERPAASLLCKFCTAQLRELAAADPDEWGWVFREMRRIARELREGVELSGTHRDPFGGSVIPEFGGGEHRQQEIVQALKARAMLARRNFRANA